MLLYCSQKFLHDITYTTVIHIALVLDEFNFKPEAIANVFNILSASFNEFSVPSKKYCCVVCEL